MAYDREWSKAVHRFKQGLKLRNKLGVLQTLCEQVARERIVDKEWDRPPWGEEYMVDLLFTSIRDEVFPQELLLAIVKSAAVVFYKQTTQPTTEAVIEFADEVIKTHRHRLMKKFRT